MRKKYIYYTLGIIVMSLCLLSCVKTPNIDHLPNATMIDDSMFIDEVKNSKGPTIVLFYNEKFWQSQDMEKRFDYFADKFHDQVKFCKIHWPINADGALYGLKLLPTTILYKDGLEVDRIKGIPPDENDRQKWNKDIERWILNNAIEITTGKYTGKHLYLFKNSYKLTISLY